MTETTVMAVFLLDFIILRCEFLLKITTGFFLRPLLWLLLTVLLLSIRVGSMRAAVHWLAFYSWQLIINLAPFSAFRKARLAPLGCARKGSAHAHSRPRPARGFSLRACVVALFF